MNEEQRRKLKTLKSSNKKRIEELQQKNNALFQECLTAIGTYQIVSDEMMINHILKIANACQRQYHLDQQIIQKNHNYYVVWDNTAVPIIKCKGNDIIEKWDDVIAVAFDTCFIDEENEQAVLIKG